MNVHLVLVTHDIPLWFLLLSLFLPRLCILAAWLQHSMAHYIPHEVGLIQIVAAVLVPRILILFWIYQDQGISLWFLIHALALLLAWGGGGHSLTRRRVRRVDVVD